MVHIYYYDQRGKDCMQLLKHERFPTKVGLYPHEGWPNSSLNTYWCIEPCFWSHKRVYVTEVIGGAKIWSTIGKLQFSDDAEHSTVYITGKRRSERAEQKIDWSFDKLKRQTENHFTALLDRIISFRFSRPNRYTRMNSIAVRSYAVRESHEEAEEEVHKMDFRLILSTNVSEDDFQLGYCATGTLEYGCAQFGNWTLAYYAMVKRHDAENDSTTPMNGKRGLIQILSKL